MLCRCRSALSIYSATSSCSLGLPLERAPGRVVTERPQDAEAVFGSIVDRARQELQLPDNIIEKTLRDAVRWGVETEDEDKEEILDEFLRRILPPSLTNYLP